VCVFAVALFVVPLQAVRLELTTSDIERALGIARDQERERARFHAPYIRQTNDATVQSIEIISLFRRVVLVAEDHILRGDRAFAYSARITEQAVTHTSTYPTLKWHSTAQMPIRRLSVC
jgi:hypothetical protein